MGKLWKILIVDDEPSNLEVLRGILSESYTLAFARSGEQALDSVRRHQPDLILLDVMMPGIDGYEVCRRLKADRDLCHIPVIFVTALNDNMDEARGFDVGAVDYLTKPVSPVVVRARVRNHIAMIDQNVVLESLSIAGEFKDNETGAHVRRMGRYSELLARQLGWSEVGCQAIAITAPLHDVGKIGIPDRVILKPGKLDEAEWALMRTHPERGAAIIGGQRSALMRMAARIAVGHHEKWDGSGYPFGLKGNDIPLESRIVAVADVYDALISPRPYKPAWPAGDVVAHIREQSGRHFDPLIVDTFLTCADEFLAVRAELPD
ncbi:two-component system response regulator [Azospirillum sp. B4]|uniref:response regulator n=1 Tax=Azospirillum sp. B4 TaxID=95605 RepID=UPI00034D0E22|nr:HD domain-containing phosphohydrolase [Azospirillum sp. B4]